MVCWRWDKQPQERRRPRAILHEAAPVLWWHRPARPHHVPLYLESGRGDRLPRHLQAAPEPFLKAIVPYQADLVVGVECLFTWYWLADLCAREGIPFVLGHALYMKAIQGGQAKHDRIEAQKIAMLLRGGMLPPAYVYPAERRATRDLLRRRLHFRRKRAALLTHVQQPNRQDNLPEIGQKIA